METALIQPEMGQREHRASSVHWPASLQEFSKSSPLVWVVALRTTHNRSQKSPIFLRGLRGGGHEGVGGGAEKCKTASSADLELRLFSARSS